jgi:hypothetical protein
VSPFNDRFFSEYQILFVIARKPAKIGPCTQPQISTFVSFRLASRDHKMSSALTKSIKAWQGVGKNAENF